VLCEKPVGLDLTECAEILQARPEDCRLATGFNYRYYPGIQHARKLIDSGAIGTLTHVRCVLGHGGRPGYEKEWKTSKELCGGGALLDPGIHAIDLLRHLAGEWRDVAVVLNRSFWPIDVEDNAFVLAALKSGATAQMHISITEWKSRFSLDFAGTDGAIAVTGRSGFYGPQAVRYTKRWPWLHAGPEDEVIEFPLEDETFAKELADFCNWIETGDRGQLATGEDCLAALRIIGQIYEMYPVKGVAQMELQTAGNS
jgi:predicted dehydrogenase